MATEGNIRNVLKYMNGFTGFTARYVNKETGEVRDNLIIRKSKYYLRNQVLVIEFDRYTLVIRDATSYEYKHSLPTAINIIASDGNIQEIRLTGLAPTMEDFFNAFIPKTDVAFT